jgi:hypothetical protein
MKLKTALSVMLAVLMCAGVSLAQKKQKQQDDSEKWLQVEVTDTLGQPLGRACVTFVPPVGEIVFRNADGRGRVRLKSPAAARYRVIVKVDGYEAQKREVTIGPESETVAFALRPRENR